MEPLGCNRSQVAEAAAPGGHQSPSTHENVPAKALPDRVGHSDAPLTLNLYSHVLDPGELSQESLEALLVWSPFDTDQGDRG